MNLSRSQMKRRAIVEAAKNAFLSQGVDGTSMDMLAKLANVSKRTVYNHFSSKDELVIELVKGLWEEASAAAKVDFQADQPLVKQLQRLLSAELTISCDADYLALARVAFDYYFHSPAELREQVQKISKKDSAIGHWAEAALREGRLKECDALRFSEHAYALIKGHYFWPMVMGMRDAPSDAEKKQFTKQISELLLARYAA
ncbi:TetR/AcrR family transcriptional regulator [Paraferrimonas haliotis]|uniref:Transcriptional regulator n=1 Tax=Paraferrimonas haliotis TaxID=2013866 RepID=A0AA37WW50_9GAMM|nr:TetR/AcrR family transcriptional regulator [Paraferrimonas haliotis]GLS83268.1 transcriptional regulator [Paraferrimonas haliotis]